MNYLAPVAAGALVTVISWKAVEYCCREEEDEDSDSGAESKVSQLSGNLARTYKPEGFPTRRLRNRISKQTAKSIKKNDYYIAVRSQTVYKESIKEEDEG